MVYEQKGNTTHEILKVNNNATLYTIVNKTVRNTMKTVFELFNNILLHNLTIYTTLEKK